MAERTDQHEVSAVGDATLLRLVWVSRAAEPLSAQELDRIEERSRFHNEAAGITGLLIVQAPHFYGIMEGPGARLLARMEVIITDPRHCRVHILREEPATTRRFVNWRLFRLPGVASPRPDGPSSIDFIIDLSHRLG